MEFLRKLFTPITAPINFIQNNFKATVLVLIVFAVISSDEGETIATANLYELKIHGPIMSAEKFLEEVEKAKDPSIKGVLVNVNSPGGLVAPSVEMMMAIHKLAKEKPVVAYAGSSIASGSYYASIGATKIMANPGSIVGSIGVIFQMSNFEELMKTVGVSMNVVKKGEYKESGTFYRQWTEKERAELQRMADNTYTMFMADVANARGLKRKESDKWANGRIFTAFEAKTIGLIDEVGSYTDAKEMTVAMAKVEEPVWHKKDKFESFMEKLEAEAKLFVKSALVPETQLVAY
ncbi:MAG: signal peptide peptidase SppA [Campylobacterales bacterium]|nr:signal peptide peptidase SppA [Campylobacterales bacterium]